MNYVTYFGELDSNYDVYHNHLYSNSKKMMFLLRVTRTLVFITCTFIVCHHISLSIQVISMWLKQKIYHYLEINGVNKTSVSNPLKKNYEKSHTLRSHANCLRF